MLACELPGAFLLAGAPGRFAVDGDGFRWNTGHRRHPGNEAALGRFRIHGLRQHQSRLPWLIGPLRAQDGAPEFRTRRVPARGRMRPAGAATYRRFRRRPSRTARPSRARRRSARRSRCATAGGRNPPIRPHGHGPIILQIALERMHVNLRLSIPCSRGADECTRVSDAARCRILSAIKAHTVSARYMDRRIALLAEAWFKEGELP